jgi:histidinol-phosphate phosphatase family protein
MNVRFDKSWSLFLDRDGVINCNQNQLYVRNESEFKFLPGVPEAIKNLSQLFGRIFIVTNQQGIGKGLYTESDLERIHQKMLNKIKLSGGRIDSIYFCPNLASENSKMRKPEIGMALKAKKDFPEVDFQKSVMVGDSVSDMEFGKRLGMYLVWVKKNTFSGQSPDFSVNEIISGLFEWQENLFNRQV